MASRHDENSENSHRHPLPSAYDVVMNLDSEVIDRQKWFQTISSLASCGILSLNFSFLIGNMVEGVIVAFASEPFREV